MSKFQVRRMIFASAPEKESQPGLGRVLRCRQRLAGFAQDSAGDVAILFGLMTMAMFMLIGAAVDIGRWLNARDQTIAAIDAAVLAAGRTLQTNGGNQTDAIAMAQRYYSEAVKNRLVVKNDTVSFSIGDNGTSVQATGNAQINTPFMALAGIKDLQLLKNSGAEHSKAMLAVGGNAELNLEISMMLDVSGSMGETTGTGNTKVVDMKDAASDLVDIVVWADQTKYTSKVAVVPFSGDVRPPSSLLTAAVDASLPASITKSSSGRSYKYFMTPCVGERPGTNRYTDAASGVGNYVLRQYTNNGSCSTPASGEVLPMTNNKTALMNKINGLQLGGATAGQVGTAWTYYMLSPKWSSVLTGLAAPVAYNTPKTEKIAILMTDGEFNSEHDSNGITVGNPGAGSSVNGSSSSSQAMQICTQMKNSGIEVYTVGFDLGGNSTAINTLKNCATDASKAYTADNGDQLKAAFRDIALKISTLYLTK